MARDLTVSIDAMGGDAGPGIVVAALARSVVRHPGVNYILHGDESELKPLLVKRSKLTGRVSIRHTSERVRMEEKPSLALRRGRNSSMWRAIESVKNKEAEVAVSAGNTGALMAMSIFQLGTLDGISLLTELLQAAGKTGPCPLSLTGFPVQAADLAVEARGTCRIKLNFIFLARCLIVCQRFPTRTAKRDEIAKTFTHGGRLPTAIEATGKRC